MKHATIYLSTALVLFFGQALAQEQPCDIDCNAEIWVLQYGGQDVPLGDLTEEECRDIMSQLEAVDESAATKFSCWPRRVKRQEL